MGEKNSARILIVEDHTEMLQVLRKFLSERGFEIVEANSGETAIESIVQNEPDVILLDVMLPGMSGIEVTRKIRNNGVVKGYIPILMLTAKSEIKDVITGLEVGADDYIIKPFSFDELIARIYSAIRIKKLNDNLYSPSDELESANQKIYELNQTLIEKNKELRKKIYDLRDIFDVSLELHSILDVDRILAGEGANKLKTGVVHLNTEGCRLVAEEAVRLLEEYGCFDADHSSGTREELPSR